VIARGTRGEEINVEELPDEDTADQTG
jgi:hypothetical protein